MDHLLSEIEQSCSAATPERISRMVQTLLGQYLLQAPNCTAEQLDLYDQALLVLVRRLTPAALSDISHRLARSDANPAATLRFLAESPDIDIAGPVLAHAQLPDEVIATIAGGKRGPQLMAIASRRTVPANISIALIDSGISAVIGETVRNHGAMLSEMAFSLLIGLAAKDRELARVIGLRTDVPDELRGFLDMFLK